MIGFEMETTKLRMMKNKCARGFTIIPFLLRTNARVLYFSFDRTTIIEGVTEHRALYSLISSLPCYVDVPLA